jgi:hypothetical protein
MRSAPSIGSVDPALAAAAAAALDHTILSNRVKADQALDSPHEISLNDTKFRSAPLVEPEKRRRADRIVAVSAVVVAIFGVTLALVTNDSEQATTTPTLPPGVPDIAEPPGTPEDPRWQSVGRPLTVRWQAPDAQPGDIYHSSRLSVNTGTAREGNVNERFATLARVNPKQRACVKILAQGAGLLAAALVTCWPDDK